MKPYPFIILVFCIYSSWSFQIGIDLNTYNTQEMNDAIKNFGHVDFTWAITVNSPDVSQQLWRQAFASLNNQQVFSQDNPMQFRECAAVRQYSGTLTAAFGYHETGSQPHTMLSWDEITQYSSRCGSGVIILTRGYWKNSEWRTNTDKVLGHPKLYGVAIEFNPNDFGNHEEIDYIHNVLAAGKTAFFLLPFVHKNNYPTESQITNLINYYKSHGINMSENRIRLVLARYDQPHIPILGSSNSIYSALKAAQKLR